MKKLLFSALCLLLVCAMVCMFAACGKDGDENGSEAGSGAGASGNVSSEADGSGADLSAADIEGVYSYDALNETVTLKDGKWSIREGDWELLKGYYEVSGSIIRLYETGESTPILTGTWKGDSLDLGELGVYTRK